jgi:hypothetical protein
MINEHRVSPELTHLMKRRRVADLIPVLRGVNIAA